MRTKSKHFLHEAGSLRCIGGVAHERDLQANIEANDGGNVQGALSDEKSLCRCTIVSERFTGLWVADSCLVGALFSVRANNSDSCHNNGGNQWADGTVDAQQAESASRWHEKDQDGSASQGNNDRVHDGLELEYLSPA